MNNKHDMEVKMFSILLLIGIYLLREVTASDRPIIGIISLDISATDPLMHWAKKNKSVTSQIVSSVVKLVEMGGARITPIRNASAVDSTFAQINGLVMFGESQQIDIVASQFSVMARKCYELAKQSNDRRDYFPILGISLGAEMLLDLFTNGEKTLTDCHADDIGIKVGIGPDYTASRLFSRLPPDLYPLIRLQPSTYQNHKVCLTEQTVRQSARLNNTLLMTTLGTDKLGTEFVSTFEHAQYPFYGIHFQPEKVLFEWNAGSPSIPREVQATRLSHHIASFFVSEAKKSGHNFPTQDQEMSALIYNYPASFLRPEARLPAPFDQVYFFHYSPPGPHNHTTTTTTTTTTHKSTTTTKPTTTTKSTTTTKPTTTHKSSTN